MKPVLEVTSLSQNFGGLRALNDVDLTVREGEIVALIGPNGAGKTTFFNCITGIYTPTEGDVFLHMPDGEKVRLNGRKPHKITAMGMARTFQNIRLSHNMSALENVMVGCQVRRKYPWWMAPLGLPMFTREEQRIRDKAMALIERLSLVQYVHEKASSLPYGAQRRLEIARALATEPKFLLLDEPAAGMNPQESVELMHFIGHIRDEFDLTILLIEHDMKVVMGVCQYIWVMEYGALIAEGEPAAIRSNPEVIKAYLGEDMVQQHA